MSVPSLDMQGCVFQLGTDTESTQATTVIYDREEALKMDYSSLTDDWKVRGLWRPCSDKPVQES